MEWWKEVLGKLRLVDMQASLKTDQAGVINVQNNTYNINISDSESLEAFKARAITVDFEQAVKEEVARKLEPLNQTLSTLSQAVSGEVVVASTLATAMENIKILTWDEGEK